MASHSSVSVRPCETVERGLIRGISAYIKPVPPPPVISPGGEILRNSHHKADTQFPNEASMHGKACNVVTETNCTQSQMNNPLRTFGDDIWRMESNTNETAEENVTLKKYENFPIFSELNQRIENQHTQRMQSEAKLKDELLTALAVTANKIANLEEAKVRQENINTDLQKSLKIKEKEISDMKTQIKNLQNERDVACSNLKLKINNENEMRITVNKLQKEKEELNAVNGSIFTELTESEKRNKTQAKQIQEIEKRCDRLQSELKETKDTLSKINTNFLKEQSEKSRLKNESEKLRKIVETLNVSLAEEKRKSSVAGEKLALAKSELKKLTESFKEESEKKNLSIEGLNNENAQLTAAMSVVSDENKTLREELEVLEMEKNTLRKEVDESWSAVDNVMKGFMEKVDEEHSSSRNSLRNWCDTTIKSLNANGRSSDVTDEASTSSSSSGKRSRLGESCKVKIMKKRRPTQKKFCDDKALSMIKEIYGHLITRRRRTSVRKKSFTSSEARGKTKMQTEGNVPGSQSEPSPSTSQQPVTSTTTTATSVESEMEIQESHHSHSMLESTPNKEDQRVVNNENTVSCSDKPKGSPSSKSDSGSLLSSPGTSNKSHSPSDMNRIGFQSPYSSSIPTRITTPASFPIQQPIPNFTGFGQQQIAHKESSCLYCNAAFKSPLKAARHVCMKPQDPRIIQKGQRRQ